MDTFILITGASTGIGYDAAREMVAHDYRVFGSVRSEKDGRRVRKELGERFTPLVFDVTDASGIARAVAQVSGVVGDRGLRALVNNAGIAPGGPLMHMPLDEFRALFEVNVFGVLAVTQAFLPLLGARRDAHHPPGRIVNISSISGGVAFPFVGAYAASKHALEAMTDALRRELALYGIDVIAIEPGPVKTPIWEKAKGAGTEQRYASTDYAPMLGRLQDAMDAENRKGAPVARVSRAIRRAIEADRPKTRYPLTALWHVKAFLPDRLLDHVARSRMGIGRLEPKP